MDDTINRKAAIESVDMLFRPFTEYSPGMVDLAGVAYNHALADVIATLKTLPPAERRGRWIDIEQAPDYLFYATCSVCGNRQTIGVSNYCPMCGARLEVSE